MYPSQVNSGFDYSRTRWLISVLDAGFSQVASSSRSGIFSGVQSALVGTHSFLVVEGIDVLADDSQHQFIGQYDIQVKADSCDLILMSSSPEVDRPDAITIQSNRSYVCTNDELFYVNKERRSCTKLILSVPAFEQFRASMYPAATARTLTEEELDQIHMMTQHFPNDAAKEITVRCRENEEIYNHLRRKPMYYKNCRSKTYECSREDAQTMLMNIREEALAITSGTRHVPYKMLGREGWFTSDDGKINCADWCNQKLAIAGIGDGHGKSKPIIQTGGLCFIL